MIILPCAVFLTLLVGTTVHLPDDDWMHRLGPAGAFLEL